MATPKKIFFSYSNQTEDLELYKKIYKHFILYSKAGFIGIIGKNELLSINNDTTQIEKVLEGVDITIPLLSTDFFNDDVCLKQVHTATLLNKEIIPVLLRSCEWEVFPGYMKFENTLLPKDKNSLLSHMDLSSDKETPLMKLAQQIKYMAFPAENDLNLAKQHNILNYTLGAVVLAIGIAVGIVVFNLTENMILSLLSFLLFFIVAIIAFINGLLQPKIKLTK